MFDFEPFNLVALFYLVVLFKWSLVKRPPLYFLGAVGLMLGFASGFFTVGEMGGYPTVERIFRLIGMLIAFPCAVLACAGASVSVKGMIDAAKGSISEDE